MRSLVTNNLFPLTLAQRDIYLDQLRHHGNPLYNVGGYIQFGEIDAIRLANAHRKLVEENDIFGLRISVTDSGVFQYVSPLRTTSLTLHDFSSEQYPVKAADRWQMVLFETALEIADTELFRVYLLKIADDHYRYVGLAHHTIMDGWGFSKWAELLRQLYDFPSSVSMKGSSWQQIALADEKYVASAKYLKDKEFWAEHLRDASPVLFTPAYLASFTDRLNIPSGRKTIDFSRAEFNEYKSLAGSVGAGASHYFLAMLAIYFSKSSERDRLVFGLPFHNRRDHRQKQMLGVFTSISPLCVDMSDAKCTVGELIQRIGAIQKTNFRHQRYPLGHIIRDFAQSDDHRSLYDVAFNYLKLGSDLSFAGENVALVYLGNNHESTPLMVTLCEYGESSDVQLHLDYNLAYFSDTDISLLAARFSFLTRTLGAGFGICIDDLEILPEEEVEWLLRGNTDSPLQDAPELWIQTLFEKQVKQTPDAIAAICGDALLTYAELNERANRVAHHLISLGIKPESLVGIYMARTMDMLVGVLGILKAGAAYVPLDQAHPFQRVQMILEDGGIQLVLTQRKLAIFFSASMAQVVMIDEIRVDAGQHRPNPDPVIKGLSSSNLAYVIHTSGSTGKPKGVQICHGNAVALLNWAKTVYTPEELNKVLASTSLNFDLSVFEMFAPLSVGGCCVIVKDALTLLDNDYDVSLINTVPSAMKVLIEQNAIPAAVRVINLAGEPLPMHVVNDLLSEKKCEKVFNLYGPSEDTTYSTYASFREVVNEQPNIGKAIAGTRLYVLSKNGKLLPRGSTGELHISGSGLVRGYLNSPDLTAEKFVENPFSATPGDRLYKTGDMVRYGVDGVLEYLGRADDQVKIRGFRIELGEIQRQLELLEGVKTAVVLAVGDNASDKHLIGFVERARIAAGPQELSENAWKEGIKRSLRACLPEYMLPEIVVLDQMPLTSNGKINKKALLAMQVHLTAHREYVAPQTPTELKVAELWARLLGVDCHRVGATTSLFDFGGHSLLFVRLANQLGVELGVKIPLRTLFGTQNIRDLSRRIDAEITVQLVEEKMKNSVIVSEGFL
jgi:amino acid adenylation domain-containing protein